MATSPGHQKSRDGSSNPHRDCQLAPVMQPSFVQHMQSMAAAMAKLTRQNQKLTREINSRRQRQEEYVLKDRPKAREAWGIWSSKVNPRLPLCEGYHT